MQLSLNIPVVLMMDEIGPAHLVDVMRRGGAQPHLPGDGPAGLAVALGGVGVNLEGLVNFTRPSPMVAIPSFCTARIQPLYSQFTASRVCPPKRPGK